MQADAGSVILHDARLQGPEAVFLGKTNELPQQGFSDAPAPILLPDVDAELRHAA
jgi:hypothetical protein